LEAIGENIYLPDTQMKISKFAAVTSIISLHPSEVFVPLNLRYIYINPKSKSNFWKMGYLIWLPGFYLWNVHHPLGPTRNEFDLLVNQDPQGASV